MRNVRKVFGSNRYLVINIPPLEMMPYFNGDEKRKAAAEELNDQLLKSVTSMNKHHRALEMDLVDVHAMVGDMVEKPSEFGFKDASHAYWEACQGQCTDDLDEYLWWDKVHLTGGAHRAIANSILLSGSLEPKVSLPSVAEVKSTIEGDKRFQSPTYTPQANTGVIDKVVKEIMDAKATEQPEQPPAVTDDDRNVTEVEEEDDDLDSDGSFSHIYFVVMVTVLLCIGFVWFARRQKRSSRLAALSGLVKNNGRGRFTPLQNMESTNA
ncbi:hypothetical protein BDB00DRAFT_317539 [Zychaea mexicana]|uniref:uncharacterized protein n=1 Tax=Zychaea mexicana TaxID=64656 RepID=UPI0022FF13E4|nr:uncharacterized protein BDB00DRAFT_317539 [Zychaea mexicana]KAI9494225.1 hypothetical protein BDB00DRAFT_317539 [Zychaea mexicana]